MSAANEAKKQGLTGISQMAMITGRHRQTLHDWYVEPNNRPLFDVALLGCVMLVQDPYSKWLPLETIRAIKYAGSAVVATGQGRELAVSVTSTGIFTLGTGAEVPACNILAVMAYRGAD